MHNRPGASPARAVKSGLCSRETNRASGVRQILLRGRRRKSKTSNYLGHNSICIPRDISLVEAPRIRYNQKLICPSRAFLDVRKPALGRKEWYGRQAWVYTRSSGRSAEGLSLHRSPLLAFSAKGGGARRHELNHSFAGLLSLDAPLGRSSHRCRSDAADAGIVPDDRSLEKED